MRRKSSASEGLSRTVRRARVVVELEAGKIAGERVDAELSLALDWLTGTTVHDLGRVITAMREAMRDDEPQTPAAELRPIDAPHLPVIKLRETNVIGRSRKCDVPIPSAKVSRRHLSLQVDNGAFVVKDLGSANRTWVNGEIIESPRPLSNGDVISLGDVSFEYAVKS